MLDDHHWHTGIGSASDDYVRGKEAMSKSSTGQIAMVCIMKRFFTIRVVKHKRYPERLHTSILGDIQNSKRALATCCTELSKKLDKVNSRGPFQLAQVCDSIEVMTSLNLKKYFHTYQKI